MNEFFEHQGNQKDLEENKDLLYQLEQYLAGIRQEVKQYELDLYKAEDELVHLLKENQDDKTQGKVGEEISVLLQRRKQVLQEKALEPNNTQLDDELGYVEADLNFAVDQKLNDQSLTDLKFKHIKFEIESLKKYLKLSADFLEECDRDKENIIKDKETLTRQIEKFKKKYESQN